MKVTLRFLAASSLLTIGVVTAQSSISEIVNVKSLLRDMTNRNIQTELPALPYKCKQFSSYSRRAVSPTEGWFSNWDWSNFLRIEKNQGRTEYVMYDHKGPGSIVRFWMTFAKGGHDGILRFYLDDSKKPILEGKAVDLLSGGKIVGAPMSSSSSEHTGYLRRGHNLYFPIPYRKSCKITIETGALNGQMDDANHVEGAYVYYNINYREYHPRVKVKTFTQKDLTDNKSLIDKVNETLLIPMPQKNLKEKPFEKSIKPKKVESIKISGARAIEKLSVKLEATNINQALRSTVLSINFDGKETVWVPIGDFFGSGYKISPYKSWYTEVTSDGTMSCSWVMPFRKGCKISFINLGDQEVKIKASVATKSFRWGKRSLYFHSSWFEKNRVKTVAHNGHTGEGAEDVNFVTLTGRGIYVGDTLTLFNEATGGGNKWWGEGDEKIYVDGEKFPSHFGTGTEDYYGYAWCRPERFHTPFIAQPDGSGDLGPGMTVNSRYRLLDNIPFIKSLKVDMELWHWRATRINYAPTVFYYATLSTKSNATRDIKHAKMGVVLSPSDFDKTE